jgi:hypothetical protein
MAADPGRKPPACSTICLPFDQDLYRQVIDDPDAFRRELDHFFRQMPELFPQAFADGYPFKDTRVSAQRGRRRRRIRCPTTGQSFSSRPSFALPYMAGWTDAVQGPWFLRAFGVPFWALARVFARDPMYWYRLEVRLGRNRIVGTTLRQAKLPEHLRADEHHQTRDGVKNYLATPVGADCCLGAALAPTAGVEDLQAAYTVFQQEAQDVQPDYRPKTVSVAGWAATGQAWLALFPLVGLLRCFRHGWLNLRSRGKRSEAFAALSEKVGDAYHALDRRSFAQRLRRLWEWAQGQALTGWLLEQVQKLGSRSREYGAAYSHPGGHRTSNLLDRVLRSMNRYDEDGQHLHGSEQACERHVRGWALLHNFRPWPLATARANGDWRSPAERLNQHRYHGDWLHNLLVSASLGGYRR